MYLYLIGIFSLILVVVIEFEWSKELRRELDLPD
jgi:hypothetical protein